MDAGPVVVVLAAGRGARFDAARRGLGHKLAQPFGDTTVLGSTLAAVVASGLPRVVVTIETLRASASRWVGDDDVIVLPPIDGSDPTRGMGDSIAAGIMARPHGSGWLLLPGDLPLIQAATLQTVAAALAEQLVVYAQHQGRRGHPVGFDKALYSELAGLRGDEGARRMLARYPAHAVEVPDAGVRMDLDTEADLEVLRALHAARMPSATVPG